MPRLPSLALLVAGLLACFTAPAAAQAPEPAALVGRWSCAPKEAAPFMGARMTFIRRFHADGRWSDAVRMFQKTDRGATRMEAAVSGTWTLSGRRLQIRRDSVAVGEIEATDASGRRREDLEAQIAGAFVAAFEASRDDAEWLDLPAPDTLLSGPFRCDRQAGE